MIVLEFNYLDIENGQPYRDRCNYDYLSIYDGDSDNAFLLSKLCTRSHQGKPLLNLMCNLVLISCTLFMFLFWFTMCYCDKTNRLQILIV